MSRRSGDNSGGGGGGGGGNNTTGGDYCAYVKGIERKTSMCDGPHFPNLQAAFRRMAEEQQRRQGLFDHLESFQERLAGGRTN